MPETRNTKSMSAAAAATMAMNPVTVHVPAQAQSQPEKIQWLSVREFAIIYRRSERTIRLWCTDGTIIDFGFSIYQDSKRQWWISLAD